MARTTIEFASSDDVMGLIRLWTLENGFEIVEKEGDNYKLYKKKGSLLRASLVRAADQYFLEISKNGSNYTLSAWIKTITSEKALTGALFHATNKPYRKQINNLLNLLELPKI